jgi:hypothetical protein
MAAHSPAVTILHAIVPDPVRLEVIASILQSGVEWPRRLIDSCEVPRPTTIAIAATHGEQIAGSMEKAAELNRGSVSFFRD